MALKYTYTDDSVVATGLNGLASGLSYNLAQKITGTAGYFDIAIGGTLKIGTGAVANESIQILIAGQFGNAATEIGGGGDAGIPITAGLITDSATTGPNNYISPNVRRLDVLSYGADPPVSGDILTWGPASILQAFGVMPYAWTIIVSLANSTAPLFADANHTVEFKGLLTDTA